MRTTCGLGDPRKLRSFVTTSVALAIAGIAAPQLGAQSADQNIVDMGLDDLLTLDVVVINVLGPHTHLAGEWMFGYHYMPMRMSGNKIGSLTVEPETVLTDFMVSPTRMEMTTHMFEVMYAPSNELTLMVMLPYHARSMDHITRASSVFSTESGGIGDMVLEGLLTVAGDVVDGNHRFLVTGRVVLPTGSISETDDTPAGPAQPLPYPMQVSTGTLGFAPGLVYLGESESVAWTIRMRPTFQVGRNSRGYAIGDRMEAYAWGAWAVRDWFSPTLEVGFNHWGNVSGADPDLNPAMVPTANPSLRGGTRLDLSPGVTFYASRGRLAGHRISAQLTLPLVESLEGPQLSTAWMLTVGWSWTR